MYMLLHKCMVGLQTCTCNPTVDMIDLDKTLNAVLQFSADTNAIDFKINLNYEEGFVDDQDSSTKPAGAMVSENVK